MGQWQYSSRLSLEASYSYFDIRYESGEGLLQAENGLTPNRNNPLDKFVLQAHWQMSSRAKLNLVLRHVSKPGLSAIPAYQAADAKFNWDLNSNALLSLIARNLGADEHLEFVDPLIGTTRALIETSYHIGIDLHW